MFCCKDGHPIKGTLERLSGVALADVTRGPDGKVIVDHAGETEIWWDEQYTLDRNGQTIFVCESGCEVAEGDLVEVEEVTPA